MRSDVEHLKSQLTSTPASVEERERDGKRGSGGEEVQPVGRVEELEVRTPLWHSLYNIVSSLLLSILSFISTINMLFLFLCDLPSIQFKRRCVVCDGV